MKVKLSIVIPIYNVEEYLRECLESIYRLNIKKEIILVNDESKDNSYKIIEEYKNRFPKETIVINQKNKGLSGARNSGLEKAKGEYIAFIDSDDFIRTNEYENFFKKGENKKLDIIIGNHLKYDKNKKIDSFKENKKIDYLGVIDGKSFFEKSIKYNNFKEEVWDDIYNRKFLLENKLKFKEKLLHEDTLFFIQALNKAKKVEYTNTIIYMYRQREGSIMSTQTLRNSQHKIFIIEDLIKAQKEQEIKIKSLNKHLLNMLWGIFIVERKVNIKILNQLSFKKIYSLKSYIKIIIMYILSFNCESIKSIEL